MKAVNLQTFYSVQPCSGMDSQVFTSYADAQAQRDRWTDEVVEKFDRWEKGEIGTPDGIVQSRLESDCFGGAVQSFTINDAALPSGIYTHEVGTAIQSSWEDCLGANKIRWGHLATARPSR